MKPKTLFRLLGWLAAGGATSTGLAACSDNSTASPTQAQVTATIQSSTAIPPVTVPVPPATATTIPTQVTTPTLEIVPTPTLAPPSTATPPVATATPVPTIPSPTPAPTPNTLAAFSPVARAISPANSGYYFTFAADGRLVFFAKAANGNRVGSWAITPGNPAWTFLTPGFGSFTPDLTLAALTDKVAGTATINELATGQTLATLQNRASPAIFSPDKKMVAFLLRAAQQAGPEQPQHFDLWVANVDGSQARPIWSGLEMANLAWFPSGRKLLFTGRDNTNRRFGLWIKDFSLSDKADAYTIIESKGLTVASLSNDGQWVAYWVMWQGEKFSGVWLARSDGSQAKKLDWTGGFRWADSGELLYLPVRQANETASALWSFQPATGQSVRLTDPARLPLKIALDQWLVAPGSKSMVYRNANDNSLWQLTFRA